MEDPLIGIFGGTFDPIHFGHINLALEIKERCDLSQIWFVPTNVSPFRKGQTQTPAEQRLEMVKLAIADIKNFCCLDVEVKRAPPSYTIETIELLEKEHPNKKFALILSDDVYAHFAVWKDAKKIREKVKLLIGRRNWSKDTIPTSIMEISGTKIRNRIQKRLYCDHLVPPKVLDYIYQNQLYFTP